ncbi:MAG TPA: hypothetical protein VHM88_05845 [Candidatus Acidoferrales bacterium]|jgi:hypothetical protein|nr:hypothetical protein [Candidatus Acidoferrales bacterium]
MPVPQLAGQRWSVWLRSSTLRLGAITGMNLSAVLVAWLLVANRVPLSANFADMRNAVAIALAALLMLVPVLRYLRAPARLFIAGLTGWAVLTCTYLIMGMFFERLHTRMGPFHVFMLGAIVYGLLGVTSWVALLLLAARRQPIVVARRRPY